MLQRFSKNRWQPLTAFPLKILDNVSSSVSGAGIAVSSHTGSTSKETKVSNLCEYCKYIFFNNSGNFLVSPP
jgi:hypothetical protein